MNECNHVYRFHPFSEQLGPVLTLNNMEAMLSSPNYDSFHRIFAVLC